MPLFNEATDQLSVETAVIPAFSLSFFRLYTSSGTHFTFPQSCAFAVGVFGCRDKILAGTQTPAHCLT